MINRQSNDEKAATFMEKMDRALCRENYTKFMIYGALGLIAFVRLVVFIVEMASGQQMVIISPIDKMMPH